MKFEFKKPENLDFNADENNESLLPEDQFLIQNQVTGLDLEKLKGRIQDRKERKKYAKHIFRFIWIWCGGIYVLMILNGCGKLKFDNSVIITLITTTTANILALFAIVANYLFSRNKKPNAG